MSHSFEPLHDSETLWLAGQIDLANEFACEAQASNQPPSLETLDKAFTNFLQNPELYPDADSVVKMVGVAFGAHLVKSLGYEWGYGADEWGEGLAVRARPGRGDVTIFPIDFVAKRYERRESPFLVDALAQIADTLRQVGEDWKKGSR